MFTHHITRTVTRTIRTTPVPPPYIPRNLLPKKEEPSIKFTQTDKDNIRKSIQDLRDRIEYLEDIVRK
jgi:hypothetical protein